MIELNFFSKTVKAKKRCGRSGVYGGTCGRGHKGYKARSGSTVKGFEGGQTPIYRRLPRRGFNSKQSRSCLQLSLKKVLALFRNGIDEIDHEILYKKGLLQDIGDTVKIIGSDIDGMNLKGLKKISVNKASIGVRKILKDNNIELVLKD